MTAVPETWILEPFEMISTSPEAEELLEFGYSFVPDLRKHMLEMMERQLLQAIRSAAKTAPAAGGTARRND